MASLFMTPDDKTLFLSAQHPGEDGNNVVPQSTWNSVTTVVPATTTARNAVIAVRRINASSIPAGTADVPAEVPEFPMPVLAVASAAAVGGLVAFRQRRMSQKAVARVEL